MTEKFIYYLFQYCSGTSRKAVPDEIAKANAARR